MFTAFRVHVLAAALLASTVATSAAPVRELVIFGDSLADTGNVYAATSPSGSPIPPSPPYFDGRFSNGPVWVEQFADALGVAPPRPSLLGGTNYAFGGAETGAGIGVVGSPGLLDQVHLYLASHRPDGDELFVLWSGANDFLIAGEDNPADAVANLDAALRTLVAAGADEILVPNLPDLAALPGTQPGVPPSEFIRTPENAGARSAAFNTQLDAALDRLASDYDDLLLHRLDAEALLDSILANPQRYGLRDVTTPLLVAPPGSDPDDYLFFDTVHVSAATHRIIADHAAQLVIPTPTAAGTGVALAVICTSRRRHPA